MAGKTTARFVVGPRCPGEAKALCEFSEGPLTSDLSQALTDSSHCFAIVTYLYQCFANV
ncbi:hypothetical protein C8N34_106143 [Gemmobacter caeni]|uniref:Uncharacterized protein n=1 Tax=Gemmobacter caeni TaxID=589035 RepID=A0A2T6B1Q8_9RHOB|nr:hypothetical protein C8N34_106143 [Gemmobacter caeni]